MDWILRVIIAWRIFDSSAAVVLILFCQDNYSYTFSEILQFSRKVFRISGIGKDEKFSNPIPNHRAMIPDHPSE